MEAFANRLRKNYRHISKWAERNKVQCYRVYDHDIPEYPYCIDIYADCLHMAGYLSRRVDIALQDAQLQEAGMLAAKVLQIPDDKVFIKKRRVLARREEQYEKFAQERHRMVVSEGGLKFWVNLTDYLDTGLFLDHRPLRARFREEAAGKEVLNLFAYTGSFSVFARHGGATGVTTVDLSHTYVQWAKDNFEVNGFDIERDEFVASDVMSFLKAEPSKLYDLVIVDPPSFSNSKRMKGTWDTQRDHPTMLYLLCKHCKPGAKIYFSNNFRNFQPDFNRLRVRSIQDISLATIPEDFRNKNIHKCYEIIV